MKAVDKDLIEAIRSYLLKLWLMKAIDPSLIIVKLETLIHSFRGSINYLTYDILEANVWSFKLYGIYSSLPITGDYLINYYIFFLLLSFIISLSFLLSLFYLFIPLYSLLLYSIYLFLYIIIFTLFSLTIYLLLYIIIFIFNILVFI
jgi:hypothetical protein